jgi:hypothetical protein
VVKKNLKAIAHALVNVKEQGGVCLFIFSSTGTEPGYMFPHKVHEASSGSM